MNRIAAGLFALLSLGAQVLGSFQYFKVIDNGNNNASPRIDGDLVVWGNLATVGLPQQTNDVEGFDLRQQRHFVIANSSAEDDLGGISDSVVVWNTRRVGGALYARNLRTGADIDMPFSPQTEYVTPRISHGYVTWQEPNNLPVRVLGRKLSDPVTSVVPISPALSTSYERFAYSDIAGNTAVWSDNPSNAVFGTRLYWRDLRSSTVRRVSSTESYQRSPRASERFIVWQDNRDQQNRVFVKDLVLGTEYPIDPFSDPTHTSYQDNPAIDGSFVVWEYGHDNKSEIYGRDLLSGAPAFRISPDDGKSRYYPDISGNTVVWNEPRANFANAIYGATIPEPASIFIFAALCTVARRCR